MDTYELAQVIAGRPDAGWRFVQGKVVSVQSHSITVTVAGGTEPVAGVKYLAPGVPIPNAGVWLISDGKDLLAIGSVAAAGRTPAPRSYRTTSQTITTGTDTAITFEAVDADPLTSWSAGSPTRLTVVAAGRYLATGTIRFASNATGYRQGSIVLGGATVIGRVILPTVSGNSVEFAVVSSAVTLAAGNYLELNVWQNSGGNLDVLADTNYSTSLTLTYLGP